MCHKEKPSVPHTPLSLTHKFNTRSTPFQHQKFLSSTHPSVNHHKRCVELRGFGVELSGVLNLGVFGVELRDFLCLTEGILVLNWEIFYVELSLRALPKKISKKKNKIHRCRFCSELSRDSENIPHMSIRRLSEWELFLKVGTGSI